jgi:hypothetical protein
MPDREAQRERDHAVDDVSKPQHGEAPMVTTTTANLRVLEPCLTKVERDTLRQFLGLLLEANEPEAMVASLRRLAERKAWYAVNGALVDRQAAQRWFALAETLAKVERQVTPQRSSPATETFAD